MTLPAHSHSAGECHAINAFNPREPFGRLKKQICRAPWVAVHRVLNPDAFAQVQGAFNAWQSPAE